MSGIDFWAHVSDRLVLDPAVTRVSVAGNILDLASPKGTLEKSFIPYQVGLGDSG